MEYTAAAALKTFTLHYKLDILFYWMKRKYSAYLTLFFFEWLVRTTTSEQSIPLHSPGFGMDIEFIRPLVLKSFNFPDNVLGKWFDSIFYRKKLFQVFNFTR